MLRHKTFTKQVFTMLVTAEDNPPPSSHPTPHVPSLELALRRGPDTVGLNMQRVILCTSILH